MRSEIPRVVILGLDPRIQSHFLWRNWIPDQVGNDRKKNFAVHHMKTIFLPIYNGIRAKNFFHTDIYPELIKDGNIRLIIAVPSSKIDYYRGIYKESNVVFEPLDITSEPWFGRLIAEIAFNILDTKTIRFKQKLEYWRYGKYGRFFIKRTLHILFAKMTFLRNVLRWLDHFVAIHLGVAALLDRHKPDLVVAPDVVFPLDRIFVRTAKQKGYTVVGLTRSWDNLTSKGVIQVLPDKLILHTSRMKQQAVDLVGMPEVDIVVTGPPDYDKYFKPIGISRDEFLQSLGIPSHRRLVLFAPFYDEYTGSALIMLNGLIRGIQDGRLPNDIHFIVRYRPATPEFKDGVIEKSEHITFTKPCEYYFPVNNRAIAPTKDWEFSPQDADLLVHSIAFSDIVVITYSTLAIDAAACDRPIIGIRFDADPNTPMKNRVTEIHDAHDHYGELEATGGIRLVNTMDEFIEGINFYLSHPDADRAGRKKMLQEQVEFTDARNGKRAAEFIKGMAYHTQ